MKNTNKIFLIIAAAFMLAATFSCKKAVSEPEPVIPDAVITFISGDAFVIGQDGEKNGAVIGEKVLPDDTLVTMYDSFLELKIGESGIIRMGADTRLSLTDLTGGTELSPGNITISLLAGSVIQKVKKITGNENYTVRTASAAFGVRGTEFLVETEGGTDTLAVKKGKVIASLYPDYLEMLEKKGLSGDRDYLEAYKAVEEASPLIGADQEITIRMTKGAGYPDELSAALDKALSGEIDKEEALSVIKTTLVSSVGSLDISDPVNISEESLKKLSYTENYNLEEPVSESELYIQTVPEGSLIYFDNNLAGYGSLKALFSKDRKIRLKVEKEGYQPFEKEIRAGDITESPYIIKLEKLSGGLSISAYPEDSEILVDGEGSFKGKYSGVFDPGSLVNVVVRKEEYVPKDFRFKIREGESLTEKVILEPMLIPLRFQTGLNSAIFLLKGQDGNLLSAGNGRGFSFFSQKGERKWSSDIVYSGKPVLTDRGLFVVTGSRLGKIDISTGELVSGPGLSESLYQKPVYSEGSVFVNSGNKIIRINPVSMNIEREYTVPDNTVSNPCYSEGRLLTVTDKGVLHLFKEKELPESSISVSRGNPGGMDIAASGETGYFAGTKGEVFSMNLGTGALIWENSFEPDAAGNLPEIMVSGDSIVIYTGDILNVYSLDGNRRFEAVENIDDFDLGRKGEIWYVKGNTLAGISLADGRLLREGPVEGDIKGISFSDGRIFAVKSDGSALVVNPDALK